MLIQLNLSHSTKLHNQPQIGPHELYVLTCMLVQIFHTHNIIHYS